MPAYFNMSLEFKREDLYPMFTYDFYELLQKSGMKFESGVCGAEENSLEEILKWNQKHLEDNFELGFTEHYSKDYKQMLFTYSKFSHTRGFWLNKYPTKSEFIFEIIIPECEIVDYYYEIQSEKLVPEVYNYYKQQAVDTLIESALVLWQSPLVRSIQTGLEECSEVSCELEIKSGEMPFAYPFAIVPDYLWNQIELNNKMFCMKHVCSDGMLLMLDERNFIKEEKL